MRISYIGPVPPLRGGIAQHGARLVAALRELGHDVGTISWSALYPRLLYRHPQWLDDESARPPAVFRLRWWDPYSWWVAGGDASRSDLIVFPWVTHVHAAALMTILKRRRDVRAVAIVHNVLPHERLPLAAPVTRVALGNVDAAVAHAHAVASDLRALAPGLATSVVGMPPTLEVRPQDLPPVGPLRLLFLGYVRPYKGVDLGFEAVRYLRDTGLEVTLTVAGEFWQPLPEVLQRVASLQLNDAVDLRPGYVPDHQISELLAAHHVLLAPYREATQSAVVPVALAAGRPVVATKVGGLAELVMPGVNGELADPDGPSLASAVRRAAASLDKLARQAPSTVPRWSDLAEAVLVAGSQ